MTTGYAAAMGPEQQTSKQYFGSLGPDELSQKLQQKVRDFDNFMSVSNHYERMRRSLRMTFGEDDDHFRSDKIGSKGSNGQISVIRPNHFRTVALNVHTLTTSQRPNFRPVATNTDHKSQTQTLLAQSILDYYMREKRVERNLKRAAWHAITLGGGFVKGSWDPTLGNAYTVVDGQEQRDGDLVFSNHMPSDVIIDYTLRDPEWEWCVVRSYRNKYTFAAKYPERYDEIVALTKPIEPFRKRMEMFEFRRETETDLIPVYEFFHQKGPAIPEGRYMLCLADKLWLIDGPLPYRRVPVFQLTPDIIFGTPFGYTNLFGCLSLQMAIDMQSSVALSNQKTFGTQFMMARRGHGMKVTSVTEGFALVEHNCPAGQEPAAVQWTKTAPEVFSYRSNLISEMGQIAGGLNDVSRGLVEDAQMSGAAMALRDAQALRFNSNLQQSYTELGEDVTSFVIEVLQDFAKSPRLVRIAGKSKAYAFREFTGQDLDQIDRVVTESTNPLFATTSGKLTVAETLAQKGLVTAQQYLGILENGILDIATEGPESHRLNIKAENERLAQGIPCNVVPTDNHPEHIREHATVWSNPVVRENPAIYGAVFDHLQQHIGVWRETAAPILQSLGIPPCPADPMPMMGDPGGPLPPPPPGVQLPPAPMMSPPPPQQLPPGGPMAAPMKPSAPPQAIVGSSAPGGPALPKMPQMPTTGQHYDPMAGPQQ